MHAVWDSVSYSYTGYADLPFDSATWDYYGEEINKMVPDFPVDPAQLKEGQFGEWANESLAMAEADSYPGFAIDAAQSPEYQAIAESDCRMRIMYGGARLAALITQIFGADEEMFLI